MKGIRTQENKEFINFFNKVQDKANEENKTFFLDTGHCKDVKFRDMELDTLFGWLIPKELEKDFENEFNNREIKPDWDKFYVLLDFDIDSGELELRFK